MKTLTLRWLMALPLLASLAGCGESDVQEVRTWMKEVDAQTKVQVPPLAEPKTFIPFAYAHKDDIEPFNPNKLLAELAKMAAAGGGNGIKPDTERRKEFLESFPLDTIKMVGTIEKKGVTYAVLQVDRTVHQVVVGQHLGQNYGRITSINETAVNLKEIVQDATGDWVERLSKLELQESKENSK
ncbi:type IV pilus assembly protein PilP [Duganella sp. CF402]|uniref:pilus assembly protein PilP n=1 Tax=unclassified Duganella TaxID=2636909 RepID=UPI0008BBB719|nr:MULTISPECIES: pilus assembly protein PilP [unclassified Duganella]RZT06044.1 type IV pilus assembly protein PilP [Duganella sp. BK701]SEM78172.1 type IV pilus assembly protein PilP [Duganella sp. CF402]